MRIKVLILPKLPSLQHAELKSPQTRWQMRSSRRRADFLQVQQDRGGAPIRNGTVNVREVAGSSESSEGPLVLLVLHAKAQESQGNENLPPSAADGKGGAQVQTVLYLLARVSRTSGHLFKFRGNCVVEETDACREYEVEIV
jgi:hypothetical protein